MKTRKELKANVVEVARMHPDGFTVDSLNCSVISEGFAVSVKETQNSHGIKGLERVIRYARENDIEAIGGWLNADNGKFYYDATRIFSNIEDAAAFAVKNEQLAFFDLKACKEYRITAAGVVAA